MRQTTTRSIWKYLAAGTPQRSWSVVLLVLVAALRNTEVKGQSALLNQGNIGLIQNLGKELFSTYVVPFEISSILFLSAMVGAVVIGRKE